MVYENKYVPQAPKQTYEVRYLEEQKLTEKDFFISCPNEDDISIDEKGIKVSVEDRKSLGGKIGDNGFEAGVASTKTEAEAGSENKVSTRTGISAAGYKDDEGEIEFGKLSAGGEIGAGEEGVSAKVGLRDDLVDVKTDFGGEANLGVKADTGFKAGDDTVEADLGGFGVKVGKKIGFETPFGGASLDLEKLGEKFSE